MRRRSAAAALTLITALSAGAQTAHADPTYPSQNDVRRAQQRATDVGSQVAGLREQLRRSQARVDAADLAVSTAAEDYDVAPVELATRRRAAAAAAAAAHQAAVKLGTAQSQVGALAAQTYRSGGSIASLEVLLSPSGPDDVLERASMMHVLAERRQRTVQQMDAARVVATTLDQQAEQAVARQTAAARKLAKARAAAQAKARTARSALQAQAAERAALLVKLAAARKTSVAVEQAREAGLRRAAELRKEAALRAAERAEAAREAAQRARNGSSSNSSGSGSGSGSNSGSGSGSSDSGGQASSSGGSSSGSSGAGQSAVAWAKQKLGLPYQWGGAGPGSYDCSGLVMRAWEQAGVRLPHSSRLQYRQSEKISYADLRPGDLVFFATNPSNEATIHHVAMYIGGGQMIEAPFTGANVRIVPLRRSDSMPYAVRP
jgi:cell wall-associated NlpC family hydrolase